MTPWDLLRRELARDGARPFLTWYDDATGARVELSVATTANWVAKIGNHLESELDVAAEDPVVLTEPVHWVTALCALAAWAVGAVVDLDAGGGEAVPGADPATFQRAVLAQPDELAAAGPAAEVADPDVALPAGARVLTVLPLDTPLGLAAGLLAPLAAHGSVVLVARPDAAARLAGRCDSERVTHTAGVSVPGTAAAGLTGLTPRGRPEGRAASRPGS